MRSLISRAQPPSLAGGPAGARIARLAPRPPARPPPQFLLGEGVDVNAKDDSNTTPLHLAAWGGHLEGARVLARRGALVTLQDTAGDQALHWAATKGHTRVGFSVRPARPPAAATALPSSSAPRSADRGC